MDTPKKSPPIVPKNICLYRGEIVCCANGIACKAPYSPIDDRTYDILPRYDDIAAAGWQPTETMGADLSYGCPTCVRVALDKNPLKSSTRPLIARHPLHHIQGAKT